MLTFKFIGEQTQWGLSYGLVLNNIAGSIDSIVAQGDRAIPVIKVAVDLGRYFSQTKKRSVKIQRRWNCECRKKVCFGWDVQAYWF